MNKIKKLREKAGLSQADFAVKAGTNQANVSKWESGAHSPRISTLKKIAKILKVEITALL